MSPCVHCVSHLTANPHIIGAAASVGIEEKKSTPEMVQIYMAGIHRREEHP